VGISVSSSSSGGWVGGGSSIGPQSSASPFPYLLFTSFPCAFRSAFHIAQLHSTKHGVTLGLSVRLSVRGWWVRGVGGFC